MRVVKYVNYLSVIIVILCLLCSCSKGENNSEIKISSSNIGLSDLATKKYSDSELKDISQFNGTIYELNDKYSIECVRKSDYGYRVSYLGDFCIAVILFDSDGNKILGNVYDTLCSKSDLSVLTENQTLENVQKIDPNGEYLFLYSGRNDTPKTSSHYTKDGYLITIEYDNENKISNIHEELI